MGSTWAGNAGGLTRFGGTRTQTTNASKSTWRDSGVPYPERCATTLATTVDARAENDGLAPGEETNNLTTSVFEVKASESGEFLLCL